MHNPSVNLLRGLCVPGMPGAMLSEGFCALVGSPMANWSWMKDQAKSDSKDTYSQKPREQSIIPEPQYRYIGPRPGTNPGEGERRQVPGGVWPLPMGAGRAQPEDGP